MSARGRIWKSGSWWRYEVQDIHGTIVLADSCSDWKKLLHQIQTDIAAVRVIESAGHRLKQYENLTTDPTTGETK